MRKESAPLWLKKLEEAKGVTARWVKKSDPYVAAYDSRFPASLSGENVDQIDNNFVYSVTRAYVSNLFFRNPTIRVPERCPEDMKDAHVASAVINAVIEETDMETSFGEAMTDAVLRGSGYLKFGFDSDSPPSLDEQIVVNSTDEDIHRENEKLLMGLDVEVHEDEDHDKHIASHQLLVRTPAILAALMERYGEAAAMQIVKHVEDHRKAKEQKAKDVRLNWRVQPQQVWVRHIDPRDILMDPLASCWEDVRWIAFRSVRPLWQIQQDPHYRNKMKLAGGGTTPHQDFDGTQSNGKPSMAQEIQAALIGRGRDSKGKDTTDEPIDPDDVQVELYEIWDRLTERVFVVCDQTNEFLRNEPSPFKDIPNFFPVVKITFATKRGTGGESEQERPLGYSLVEPWHTEQLALNALESLRLTIAKSNIPKYVADPSVPDTAIDRITNGDVGTVIKLDAATSVEIQKDPRLAFTQVQMGATSMDIHQAIQNVKDMISFKSGLGAIQLGQNSREKTATGIQVQVASQSAILDKMLDVIENAFKHGAKIIRALVRQFFETERVVALTGPNGQTWETYLGRNLYGGAIEVDTRTSAAANNQVKSFQALQAYNLLAANPTVKLRELTDWTLRSLGVPTPSIFLKTDEELAAEAQAVMAAQAQAAGQPAGASLGPQDVQFAQQKAPNPAQVQRNALGDPKQDRSML
jgi:hypothetical protein